MAFRHFGGKTPTVDVEWTCPSCNAQNTTPLKAGCQTCGAGGDAKKVGAPAVEVWPEGAPKVLPAEVPGSHNGFDDWYKGSEDGRDFAWRAFMAGVTWAQAQRAQVLTYAEGGTVTPNPQPVVTPPVTPSGETPAVSPTLLMLCNGSDKDGAVDPPTLQTILAALAFYRDNVLGYGPVPGELNAEGVSALIARLSPQETEA